MTKVQCHGIQGRSKDNEAEPAGRRSHGPSAGVGDNEARRTSQLRPNNAERGSPPPPDVEEPGKRRPTPQATKPPHHWCTLCGKTTNQNP